MKVDLMDYFSVGEENAITARELASRTGMNTREITMAVNRLRCDGEVILSSGAGFFLPADTGDVLHFVRQMRSRQREIGRAAKSARDYLKAQGVADG